MAPAFKADTAAKSREEKLARLQELRSLKSTISSELQAMSVNAIALKVEQRFFAHKQHHDENVLKQRKTQDINRLLDNELFSSDVEASTAAAPPVSLEQQRRQEDEEWLKTWKEKKAEKVSLKISAMESKKYELVDELKTLFTEELDILINFNDDTSNVDLNSAKANIAPNLIVKSVIVPTNTQEAMASSLYKIQEQLQIQTQGLCLDNNILKKDLIAERAKTQKLELSLQAFSNPHHVAKQACGPDPKVAAMKLKQDMKALSVANDRLSNKLAIAHGQVEDLESTCHLLSKEKHFLAQDLEMARQEIRNLTNKENIVSDFQPPSWDYLSHYASKIGKNIDGLRDTSDAYNMMLKDQGTTH